MIYARTISRMWTFEHTAPTTASPDAVWALWSDVGTWKAWNADIMAMDLRGPFASGTAFTMNPGREDAVELVLADVVPGESFTDEARFGDLVLRTTHRIEHVPGAGSDDPGPDGARPGLRVVYRMEISGPGADEAGPELGPQITSDWPETIAALVALAEAR
ncbi:hypothetical protein KDY119_02865 [Luteimicrobium xylanilyticum]|uniref:Uncharacterized protein n=2 Tax=Luteimicrobium xylanilyticum TaxID=1133546 RepID=A0A5P9QD85_9MICO|nr:hypothetical protein KDY119_02865 [Luteimicrobium xylanilyticum]